MKKLTLTLLSLTLTFSMFAGGIVTNTNQSAAWSRMLVRDATTDIDAAFYNPAGLTKLADGFHLAFSSQTVTQTRTINNDLLNKDFEGSTFAPVFPSLYAVYKTGKVAFSFGFMGIGGGGTVEFDQGVPQIELGIASMPGQMAALGATGPYTYNSSLSGSSIYWGIQAGVSYEINDMISIYAGGRYVIAQNTYEGVIEDVSLATSGDPLTNASVTGMAEGATGASISAAGASTGMDPIIAGGGGGFTLAQLVGASMMTQADADALNAGYTDLGGDPTDLTAAEMQGGFDGFETFYDATATTLYGAAGALANQKLDAEQTGSGFTPIVGVNLAFMDDKLNIGIKYEFQTNLELTNKTTFDIVTDADGNTMYPDGAKVNADMPAMLSIGVAYQLTEALNATFGFHTYFDSKVGWKKTNPFTGDEMTADDFIDKNYMEYGLGLEYAINEQLLVSAGWLGTKTGVKDTYHSDLSQSYNTNSIGAGGAYRINDMLKIQLGGYYTMYQDIEIEYVGYSQIYQKTNWAVALGLDFTFGGGE